MRGAYQTREVVDHGLQRLQRLLGPLARLLLSLALWLTPRRILWLILCFDLRIATALLHGITLRHSTFSLCSRRLSDRLPVQISFTLLPEELIDDPSSIVLQRVNNLLITHRKCMTKF